MVDERGLTPPPLLVSTSPSFGGSWRIRIRSARAPLGRIRQHELGPISHSALFRASEGALSLMTLGGHRRRCRRSICCARSCCIAIFPAAISGRGGLDQIARRLAAASRSSNTTPNWCASIASGDPRDRAIRGQREIITADRVVLDPALLVFAPYPGRSAVSLRRRPDHREPRLLSGQPLPDREPELVSGRTRTSRAAPATDGPGDIWDMSFGLPGRAGILSVTTGGPDVEAKLSRP